MTSTRSRLDVVGAFWPAAHPEKRLPGRLTFSPYDGGRLDVVGSFHDPREVIAKAGAQADGPIRVGLSELVGGESPPIRILADTTEGPATLEQCLGAQSAYHIPLVLCGANIAESEPLRFQTADFRIPHFIPWSGISGFSSWLHSWNDPHRPRLKEVHISYTPVPEASTDIPHGRLLLRMPYRFRFDRIPESPIEETSILELQFADSGSVADVLQTHHALQVLMAIALAAPVQVAETRVQVDGEQGIHIHAQGVGAGSSVSKTPTPHRINWLFTYTDLGGLNGIGRWLTISREFRPAVAALWTHWYAPHWYHDLQFFNMVAAAEAIERIQQNKQTFKLKQALKKLADQAGLPFLSVIGHPDRWAESVVRTRDNHVVHFGLRGDPEGEALYWLTRSVYILVVLCLLRKCGVTEDNLPRPETCPWMATLAQKLSIDG